jgi:hypothetical protein
MSRHKKEPTPASRLFDKIAREVFSRKPGPYYVTRHRLAKILCTDVRRSKITRGSIDAFLDVGDGKLYPLYRLREKRWTKEDLE